MNMNAGGRKVSSESLLWADLIVCDMKKWVWYQTFLNQVNSGEDGDYMPYTSTAVHVNAQPILKDTSGLWVFNPSKDYNRSPHEAILLH